MFFFTIRLKHVVYPNVVFIVCLVQKKRLKHLKIVSCTMKMLRTYQVLICMSFVVVLKFSWEVYVNRSFRLTNGFYFQMQSLILMVITWMVTFWVICNPKSMNCQRQTEIHWPFLYCICKGNLCSFYIIDCDWKNNSIE